MLKFVPVSLSLWMCRLSVVQIILVLLLHVVVVTIVPLLKGATGQTRVGLRLVVVGGDQRSDGGLVDHFCRLTPPGQWAGRLVPAVASLLGRRFGSFFRDHFGIVLCHNLGHVAHRSVADLDVVSIKAAS